MDNTIEAIDSHIDQNTDAAGNVVGLDDKGVICQTYFVAKPILGFVKGLLFFRPKWQQVLSVLMSSLDATCSDDTAVAVP